MGQRKAKEKNGNLKKQLRGKERIDSAFKERFQARRLSLGITVLDLEKLSGVHARTIKKLENLKHPQTHFNQSTLVPLARAMDTTLPELLSDASTPVKAKVPTTSFISLASQLGDVDKTLMPLIRDLRAVPGERIAEAYVDLLYAQLKKKGNSFRGLSTALHNPLLLANMLGDLPKPDLTIRVEKNFKRLSFSIPRRKTLVVDSPELLWDCHCKTPSEQPSHLPCPIHSDKLGTEVAARFRGGYIMICYQGLNFYWRNEPALWPPSVDTFWMLEELEKDGLFKNEYETVLDLGSGTGFLGIVTAKLNQNVSQLDMSDWMLSPFLYSLINWGINRKDREYVRVTGNLGLFTEGLSQDKRYDLVLCNPPYLPLLKGYEDLGLESTVAGVDLLTHVIENAKALGKKIYLQFSNLARRDAESAAEKAGVNLVPVGRERKVPFRIPFLWDRKDYLHVLEKDRGLIDDKKQRHRYWHRIQTYVLE